MSAAIVAIVALMAYRVLVLGTCSYAVFWLGYSGWWFLLALALVCGDEAEFRRRRP